MGHHPFRFSEMGTIEARDIPRPAGGFWWSSSPAEDRCGSSVTSRSDRPAGATATSEPGLVRATPRCGKIPRLFQFPPPRCKIWVIIYLYDLYLSISNLYHQKILKGSSAGYLGHFQAIHLYPISCPRIPWPRSFIIPTDNSTQTLGKKNRLWLWLNLSKQPRT